MRNVGLDWIEGDDISWDKLISNAIGLYWIKSYMIRSDNIGLDQIG